MPENPEIPEEPPLAEVAEAPPSLPEGDALKIAATEEVAEIPKEIEPMIEVHEPHEAVHSWKDAFIHIAIIVVGLLIAVGLDEAAEHFHHMRQVRETREALNKEFDYNTKLFQQTSRDIRVETAEYQNNLLVFEYL